MPTASIVIRALNEAAHIARLLAAIAAQSTPPDEVILVDSGSVDGTVQIAEQFGCKILHIPPSEFTFGRALNWGCEAAKGDVLVLVSAHVYPLSPSWLDELLLPFEDPEVAISYGGQTGDHRSNFAEIRLLERWFPEEGSADQDDPFCNNANCAVRRSVWEQLPYDETLPGLEDLAFARDARKAGHKISYVPQARIAHVHEERFDQTRNRYRREAMAYQHIFGRREITATKAVTLAMSSIAGDARAAIKQDRAGDIVPAIRFRIAQYLGAYQGYRTDADNSRQVVRRMYYPR